ncbi:biorientation of chromosomes in cell division protein 1-like 1 [Hetaerina americana]|uniref:biorientation of chromosomes in cell division protein 1-like 1 n=1 Tax=Hetaerina americana TaxID=62018 RepID=UPI003A7F1CEE
MDVSMIHLPPGDPGLIDKIVCQLKSNGIFDQFRKECIADVDTKPAYQNLRQRVEGSVSSFLSNQEWKPDLNKNQLRDSLRKHIHESGFLDIGVERIVDQVVNPKMYTVFFPKVEDVVYDFLRLEKPKKGTDVLHSLHYGIPKPDESKPEKKFVSLKDLLPTDLDPISPEKLESDEGEMEEAQHTSQEDFDATAKVAEVVAPRPKKEEEVGVEWGPRVNSTAEGNGALEEEEEDEEEEEEEDEASPPFESLDAEPKPTVSLAAVASDMLDNITSSSSSSSSSASEAKEVPLQFAEAPRGVPPPFVEVPKVVGSPKGEDRRGPSPPVAPAEKEEERREEKRRREEGGIREEAGGKGGEEKARGGEVGRREKEGKRREEGSRGERKEGGGGSQSSSSSRRDKSRSSEDKRRERRDEHHHHHSSSSSKRTEGSRRAEGSGKEDEHWKQKKSKERGHSSSSGSKDKAGVTVPTSTARRPGGEKASHHGSHHHHHGGSGSSSHRSSSSGGGHRHSGERKDEGKERSGSKKKSTDDHRYERDKKGRDGHRRWDRERSREGRGGCGEQGSGSKQPMASGASSSSSGGGTGKGDGGGGASECGEGERSRKREAGSEGERKPPPVEKAAGQESTGGGIATGVPPPLTKMKKPKIAANVFEVKKIIQERKRLEREKAEAEEAAAAAVKAAAEGGEQKQEGACLLGGDECLSESSTDSMGEVLYLKESADNGFVSYVHGLTQDAEGGDYSRVLIVGVPPQDSGEEGSSSADYLELSDVDLSREEQETLTRLGACVERKQREEAKIEAIKASPVPLVAKSQVEEEGSSSGKRPRRPNPRYNSGEYSTYSDEEGGLLEGEQESEGEEEEDDLGRQPQESVPSSLVEGHPPIDMGPDGGEAGGLSGGQRRRRGPVVGRRLGVRGPLRRVVTPDAFVMPLSPESDVSTASGEAGRKALPVSKESHADAELVLEDFESESRHPQPPPLLMVMGVGDGYQHPAAECDKAPAEGIMGGVGGHPSCRLDDGEQRRHDESPASLGTRRMRGTRSSSRVQQRYSSDDLYKPRPNITLGRRNRGKNSPSQEDSFLEGEGDGERGSPVVSDVVLAAPVEATASLAVDSLPNKKRRR